MCVCVWGKGAGGKGAGGGGGGGGCKFSIYFVQDCRRVWHAPPEIFKLKVLDMTFSVK